MYVLEKEGDKYVIKDPYTGLYYGSYEDREEANDAIRQLREEARDLNDLS